MKTVSVCILNWNCALDTLECLESVKKSILPKNVKLNHIIVDNGSTDDSQKTLGALKGIVLIKNSENLGFCGGNNVAIEKSLSLKSDYIFILNPDLRIDKKCIFNLVNFISAHPDASILSPKIYFYPGFEYHQNRYSTKNKGKVIWSAGGEIDWNLVLGKNSGLDEVDVGQYSTPREITFATGAALFTKADVFNQLKGFNEKYFLYLEDADFSLRATRLGIKMYFVPDAHVWHKNSRSSQVGGDLHDYYISRNRLLFGLNYATNRLKLALIRESFKIILSGRKWQKRGILDFYLGRLKKGSFEPISNAKI